jgi:hypothetical protein
VNHIKSEPVFRGRAPPRGLRRRYPFQQIRRLGPSQRLCRQLCPNHWSPSTINRPNVRARRPVKHGNFHRYHSMVAYRQLPVEELNIPGASWPRSLWCFQKDSNPCFSLERTVTRSAAMRTYEAVAPAVATPLSSREGLCLKIDVAPVRSDLKSPNWGNAGSPSESMDTVRRRNDSATDRDAAPSGMGHREGAATPECRTD